jgi:hypothetical protein
LEKYTAIEWAAMEGGHDVTPTESKFSFIKDLNEARFTRNERNVRNLSYTDCRERIYLIVLAIELMRTTKEFLPWVRAYSKQTSGFEDYRLYRGNGTDLYNYLHLIISADGHTKLKDSDSALKMKAETKLPLRDFNRYIIDLAKTAPRKVDNLLFRVEQGLKITNPEYKSIRRSLASWDSLQLKDRNLVATKLLFAVRAKLRSSDIIDDFERWVVITKSETYYAVDTEPQISQPDVVTTPDALALYRYLVGANNLAMTKQFIEHVKDGRSISAPMVKAYAPIIQMVDDIVQGGPGFINQLQVLRSRAQKRNK